MCIAIRNTCRVNASAVTSFEELLFPPIDYILQQDVQGEEDTCFWKGFCVFNFPAHVYSTVS